MLSWAETPNHLAGHLYFLRGIVWRLSSAEIPPVSRPFDVDAEIRVVRTGLLHGLRHSSPAVVRAFLADSRANRPKGREAHSFAGRVMGTEARLYAEALNLPGLPVWRPPSTDEGREVEIFAMRAIVLLLILQNVDVDQMEAGLAAAQKLQAEYDEADVEADCADRRIAQAAEAFYEDFLTAVERRPLPATRPSVVH